MDIIADSERASFGIGSNADLKRAVGKYFGKDPNYAYLKSPTPPFGDLYKKHGISQVQRVLKPIKAEILGIKTKPTIVSANTLTNSLQATKRQHSPPTSQNKSLNGRLAADSTLNR